MKQAEIHVGGKYQRIVRGRVHIREVLQIQRRKESSKMYLEDPNNPNLFQGKHWNQQMVVFCKYYGGKDNGEVTLPIFARWAEREIDQNGKKI